MNRCFFAFDECLCIVDGSCPSTSVRPRSAGTKDREMVGITGCRFRIVIVLLDAIIPVASAPPSKLVPVLSGAQRCSGRHRLRIKPMIAAKMSPIATHLSNGVIVVSS